MNDNMKTTKNNGESQATGTENFLQGFKDGLDRAKGIPDAPRSASQRVKKLLSENNDPAIERGKSCFESKEALHNENHHDGPTHFGHGAWLSLYEMPTKLGGASRFAPTYDCGYVAGLNQGLTRQRPRTENTYQLFERWPLRESDYYHFRPKLGTPGPLQNEVGQGLLIASFERFSGIYMKPADRRTTLTVTGSEYFEFGQLGPINMHSFYKHDGLKPKFDTEELSMRGLPSLNHEEGTITISLYETREGFGKYEALKDLLDGDTGLRVRETFRVNERFVEDTDGEMHREITLERVKTEIFEDKWFGP